MKEDGHFNDSGDEIVDEDWEKGSEQAGKSTED